MAVLSTFKRYELKYTITDRQAEQMLEEIKSYMLPDEYCRDGKRYSIFNLYFDNDSDSIVQASVKKPFFKEKLRLRSYYSSPSDDTPVYFEIKRKINKVVTKRRAAVSWENAKKLLNGEKIPKSEKYIDCQVLDEIDYFIKTYSVYPKVYIRYDRQAFFGKDDKSLRMTFDDNIITRRDNVSFGISDEGTSLLPPGYKLMEIKISDSIPLWLVKAIEKCGIKRNSFSKYGNEFTGLYVPNSEKYNNIM